MEEYYAHQPLEKNDESPCFPGEGEQGLIGFIKDQVIVSSLHQIHLV